MVAFRAWHPLIVSTKCSPKPSEKYFDNRMHSWTDTCSHWAVLGGFCSSKLVPLFQKSWSGFDLFHWILTCFSGERWRAFWFHSRDYWQQFNLFSRPRKYCSDKICSDTWFLCFLRALSRKSPRCFLSTNSQCDCDVPRGLDSSFVKVANVYCCLHQRILKSEGGIQIPVASHGLRSNIAKKKKKKEKSVLANGWVLIQLPVSDKFSQFAFHLIEEFLLNGFSTDFERRWFSAIFHQSTFRLPVVLCQINTSFACKTVKCNRPHLILDLLFSATGFRVVLADPPPPVELFWVTRWVNFR